MTVAADDEFLARPKIDPLTIEQNLVTARG
jgi:hypothetical protein